MERHEKQHDRDNEEEIIRAFCWAFGLTYEKLWHEGRYCMDFGLYNDHQRLVSVAEVKERSQQYDTVILDLSKAMSLWEYYLKGFNPVFVVRVKGEVRYYKFCDKTFTLFKKTRRHVSNVMRTDNGPVIDIPWSEFRELPEPVRK